MVNNRHSTRRLARLPISVSSSYRTSQVIAPTFERLSDQYRHATFIKVDTDAHPSIMQKYDIRALPTFKFIKNGVVVDSVFGADAPGLVSKVQTYAGPAPATSASTSSDPSSTNAKVDGVSAGDVSLLEFLDSAQLNCLNEADEHGVKSILSNKGKNKGSSYLQSDADEQLLINIPFHQTVRVRSISIQSEDLANAPKAIKLFVNKPSLGFEDVEDAKEPEASQIIQLSEDDVKDGKRINLRFVRFQNVNSLHIFVASNQGGEEETKINSIDIFGLPVQVTKDLGGLRKALEEQ